MTDLPDDVVLSVENLSIDFRLRTHILHAVERCQLRAASAARRCASSAKAARARAVTARSLLQHRRQARRRSSAAASCCATASDDHRHRARSPQRSRAMRGIRGRRIGLIFQEPMSSLSPVHTIGSPDHRGDAPAQQSRQARRRARASDRAAAAGRNPQSRQDGRPLHVRVLGRHAAARHDRHGARRQSRIS